MIQICTKHLSLFSHQVVSDSLRPRGLQHTRLLCPSPSPRVCPSSCPLNQWCHPTISSSLTLFFCLLSFPASGSFPMSQVFYNESVLRIRWPKYWCFNFSTNPFSEYSGLISITINWVDLLAAQGTPKGLYQWVGSLHQVAKVLELQLQHQSFQWIFRVDFL